MISNVLPMTLEVDIDGCADDEEFQETRVHRNGWMIAHDHHGGFCVWKLHGVTANGVHVVEVGRNGGGSGVFMDVLLLRRSRRRVTEDGVPRPCNSSSWWAGSAAATGTTRTWRSTATS